MDGASGNLRRGEGFKICSSLACGVKETNLKHVSVSLCFFLGGFLHPTNGLSTNQDLVHVFVASQVFFLENPSASKLVTFPPFF